MVLQMIVECDIQHPPGEQTSQEKLKILMIQFRNWLGSLLTETASAVYMTNPHA